MPWQKKTWHACGVVVTYFLQTYLLIEHASLLTRAPQRTRHRRACFPPASPSMSASLSMPSTSGFNFDLHTRNVHLGAQKGLHLPKATSTGTTIVGCIFKDGVVLGADTRATEGPIVADKNCEKVSLFTLPRQSSDCDAPQDTLYHQQHSMLRCRNSCRHRICYSAHLEQHATSRAAYGAQSPRSYRNDNAQAASFPVRFTYARWPHLTYHI